MPYDKTTFRRDELHAQIWAEPLCTVARRYGLTDSGLAKICRQLAVPKPPRGYWAKKAAGHEVPVPPLPPLRPGQASEHQMEHYVQPEPTEEDRLLESMVGPESPPVVAPFEVLVSEKLVKPHQLIVEAKDALAKVKYLRNGLVDVHRPLSIEVSREQAGRALRILDALVKAVERAGHSVRPWESYGERTHFLVSGEVVEFKIRERLRKKVQTEPKEPWPHTTQYAPTGDLRLHLSGGRRSYVGDQVWEDKSKARLEAQINDVFVAVLQIPVDTKRRRSMSEARESLWNARRDEERQQERERVIEKERVDALVAYAQLWDRATVVRGFIQAVRAKAVERGFAIAPGTRVGDWLAWADRTAAEVESLDTFLGQLGEPAEQGDVDY
jgi:hypothetical protein